MVRELRYIIKIPSIFFIKIISSEFDNDAQQDAAGILEEIDETDENEDVDEENNMIDMELDEFNTVDNSAEEKNDDVPEEFPSIPGVNEIDDNSAEPLEEVYTYCSLLILYVSFYL